MTNNYLKIVTHRQREGDPHAYLVSAFVFFDDRDAQDRALAVAHARLLAEQLRKEEPEIGVQISVYRRMNSHSAIACIAETAADENSSVAAVRDTGLSV